MITTEDINSGVFNPHWTVLFTGRVVGSVNVIASTPYPAGTYQRLEVILLPDDPGTPLRYSAVAAEDVRPGTRVRFSSIQQVGSGMYRDDATGDPFSFEWRLTEVL